MGADALGEPESSTADGWDGPFYQGISQTFEIREESQHWTGLRCEYEELQELCATVHRIKERGDEGETLEAINGENWTIFRYGPRQVRWW